MTRSAVKAFRRDVVAGAYFVEWWPAAAAEATRVAESYSDLGLGLTDVSLVVLARRLDTFVIATFDERHFQILRPLSGAPAFILMPADMP